MKKSSARIPCACDRRHPASPARPGAARRDPRALQDLPYRRRRYRDAEPGQLAVNAAVPHDSFSRASRSTTDRTLRRTVGRPERRSIGSLPASSASHARSGHVSRE